MSHAMNAEACKTLERLGYEWKSLDGRHYDWYGPAEVMAALDRLRAGIALCLYFGRLGKEQIRVAVLDAPMLREALAFVAPDGTPDQDEDAVVLAGDWGHSGRGVYCYMADYPDEGSIKLTGDGYEAKPAAPVPSQDDARDAG